MGNWPVADAVGSSGLIGLSVVFIAPSREGWTWGSDISAGAIPDSPYFKR